MNERWKYSPLWILTLPLTLGYFAQCLFVYRARKWRWVRGRFECVASAYPARVEFPSGGPVGFAVRSYIWGQPQGQNIGGRLIVYDTVENRDNAKLRAHELVHTVQGELWSLVGLIYAAPLAYWIHWSLLWSAFMAFPVAYGIGFVWKYRSLSFWKAYRANHFEERAYSEAETIEPGEWT